MYSHIVTINLNILADHTQKVSRRNFLTSAALSAGALAVPNLTGASTSPLSAGSRKLLPMCRHSLPMPKSGIYDLAFSEAIDGIVPCNLDGDELTDWIAQPIIKGKSDFFRLEARNYHGDLLWKFHSGLNGHRVTHTLHVPVTVWDFDGDGIDEVITVKLGPTDNPPVRAFLVMLDGKTGEERALTPVPWAGGAGNSRYNHGTTRCYGTVAFLDGPTRPPSYVFQLGTYVDGVVWAFDLVDGTFRRRWDYQHAFHLGTCHHGITAFDIDEDGRDEILMGGTVLDADGCQIFSWSDRDDVGHTDFVLPGKIDPDKPGYQLLFGFELGYGMALTSATGEVYWRNKDFYHAHSGWVAKAFADVPGEQIRCISKVPRDTWVQDGYPPNVVHDIDRTKPWNGMFNARGEQIDFRDFAAGNRPPQWSGGEVYDSWSSVKKQLGHKLDYTRIAACDLGGGPDHGAEEIVGLRDNLLEVHFNQSANPFPSRWANTNYRKMAVSSLGSGYFFKETFRVVDPPVRKYLPTAHITVDSQRNLGIRKQKTVSGVRLLEGQKYILFRDANHQFLGSTSWDSSGRKINSYEWDWGDGTPVSREADPVKRFERNGSYTVTLTVESGTRRSREQIVVEIQDIVIDYISHAPHSISVGNFDTGVRLYTDVDIEAQSVPEELKGMSLIRTNKQIESRRGEMLFSWVVTNLPFESILFKAPIEMEVFVAMDEYAASKLAPNLYEKFKLPNPNPRDYFYWPEWIPGDGWARTNLSVTSTANQVYQLYKKTFRPGDTVRIGPNRYQKSMVGDWDREMYFVLLSKLPLDRMDYLFES